MHALNVTRPGRTSGRGAAFGWRTSPHCSESGVYVFLVLEELELDWGLLPFVVSAGLGEDDEDEALSSPAAFLTNLEAGMST